MAALVAVASLPAIWSASQASRADDTPPAPAAPRRGDVTILHTNDWHGYAVQELSRRAQRRGTPLRGGVAAMAGAFAKLRAERGADKVLALDGGDLLTGHAAASLAEDGVIGATFIKAWNEVGSDGWVIGNHDFDAGRKNAEAIVALARAPCLVANLKRAEDGEQLFSKSQPYKVFERGGLKVGVIGLTTADLARLATAQTMAGVKVLPLAAAVKAHLPALEKECDLVVALTHAGIDADRELARAVPELDVIVGGHSHTRLQTPIDEGTTVIVQAGANGREFGRLDITVEGGKIVKHKGSLVAPVAVTPTAALAEALGKIVAHVQALEGEVIGETAQALTRGNYHAETLLGSFVAEAIRDAAQADVGFMNSGGIRAEFGAGKVSRADLLKVIPNDNELAVFEVTGAELEAICRHNAQAGAAKDHGILQVAGIRYRWKREKDGDKELAKLVWVEVGGGKIDPAKTYRCASNGWIVMEQAEKYFGFAPKVRKPIEKTMHSALLAAFKRGPIEAPDRGRMQEERAPRPPRPEEPVPATGTARPEPVPAGAGDDDGE